MTWNHELNSYVWKWFKSHAQGMFARRGETKLIATPYEVNLRRNGIWRHWRLMWLKWLYFLDLEYRYVVLSRGCNTNHRQVSSAQTNQTQVLTWEKTLSTSHALSDLEAFSWLGWIVLETSFPKSPRSLKTEFGVKSYGIFYEMTYAIFLSCGSAVNFRSSAAGWSSSVAPVQVITANFRIGSIYTHPTPPDEAVGSHFIPNSFQAICEFSVTPLFVRVSD